MKIGPMTSRARLTAIFRGEAPDRPAIKLWGLCPGQSLLSPAYRPIYKAGMAKTDLFLGAGSNFHLYWGAATPPVEVKEQATSEREWIDVITTITTPQGKLRGVHRRNLHNKPGYDMEHFIKEPGDLDKFLSLPYRPFPFDASGYFDTEKKCGERGLVYFGLDHGSYGLQRIIGSENLALWCRDPAVRRPLLEGIRRYAERVLNHAKAALAAGIRGVYGWVGPELFIPPLLAPEDFDALVTPFDRKLIELIHEGGGAVWVHCHGRMKRMLSRFVGMGVDVLNPIEPPPMGDVSLAEAFALAGNRMGLEGNIETHDLKTASESRIRKLVREALDTGAGRRHILCPSSGYMEDPFPDPGYIRNQLLYIEEAYRCVHRCR